jgi:uncharacterized protein YukE
MKKLTADQIKHQGELALSLESIAFEITEAVQTINTTITTSRESVESLRNRYNERIREVMEFMQSTHHQQENYFDERSTNWQEGDAGQSYESWMDEWSVDLEELDEVELPEEVEGPEFEAVTLLRELPEQP